MSLCEVQGSSLKSQLGQKKKLPIKMEKKETLRIWRTTVLVYHKKLYHPMSPSDTILKRNIVDQGYWIYCIYSCSVSC